MRPVVRGSHPVDAQGNLVVVHEYQEFRRTLIERIGQYCSYCEMKLDASLAIEHIKPKTVNGVIQEDRLLDWNNFLFACVNCNSTKGDNDVDTSKYFWADRDNTFRAFEYQEGGCITAAPHLSGELLKKANRTLQLTGLDKTPLDDTRASDRRWLSRKNAWEVAHRALARLQSCDTLEMREQIVENMVSCGYWSIWMTVFSGDADMRRRFIQAIAGTDSNCFDATNGYEAVQRAGGTI